MSNRSSTRKKHLAGITGALNLLFLQKSDAFVVPSRSLSAPAVGSSVTSRNDPTTTFMTPPSRGWYNDDGGEEEEYYSQQSYYDDYHDSEKDQRVGGGIWEDGFARQQQQQRQRVHDFHPMGRSNYYGPDPWGRTQSYVTTSSGVAGAVKEEAAVGGRIPGPNYLSSMPPQHGGGRRSYEGGGYYDDYSSPPREDETYTPPPIENRIRMMDEDLTIDTILPNQRQREAPDAYTTFSPQAWAHENIHVVGGQKHDLLVEDSDDRTHYLPEEGSEPSEYTQPLWNMEQFHSSQLDFSRVGQDVPLDIFFYYDNPPPSTTPTIVMDTTVASTNTDNNHNSADPTNNTPNSNPNNSVATMMTQEHKRVLIEELGYRRNDVKRLKFDKAQEIIQYRIQCPPEGPYDEWCT